MLFNSPLTKATLIRRYKRFFADVLLENGEQLTVHCPNTGTMKSCGNEGDTVYLSYHGGKNRKLDYSWELTETKDGFIGVNTHKANALVAEALFAKKIPEFSSYNTIRSEAAFRSSRIDFMLSEPGLKNAWIEVKNVTLFENEILYFPDAVTTRGLKHLHELMQLVSEGARAAILFLINRPDGKEFRPATHIDLSYAETLKEAQKKGVEVLAYRVHTTLEEMVLTIPTATILT